jgi:hypothetical protein
MLGEKLQQHFGEDSVFFDVHTIPLGVDFREYIENAVGKCDVLIAIIGDQWLGAVDGQGNRRLDDPSDFVRIEIESALKRSIPVIPVLVDKVEMPSAKDLPQSIQSLVFRNATELRAGRDLHQHTEQLIEGLKSLFGLKNVSEEKAQAKVSDRPAAPQTYSNKSKRVLQNSPITVCLLERFHPRSLITQSPPMPLTFHWKMCSYSMTIQFSEA